MARKDFFSEPVTDDFQGDEEFADMQSFDLFEEGSDAGEEEGFAALSDVDDDAAGVPEFSDFDASGLLNDAPTDKKEFGDAVYQSIVNEPSVPFTPAQEGPADVIPRKKQEYKPLTWPKAEPLRRPSQPAPQPVQPEPQPVQPEPQPAQPVSAPRPEQPAQPAAEPQPEPVYAEQPKPATPVEPLFDDFDAAMNAKRSQSQPYQEEPTQVFTMHSPRPAAQPKASAAPEKSNEEFDDFAEFGASFDDLFSSDDAGFDGIGFEESDQDGFGGFDEEPAPKAAKSETAAPAEEDGSDDWSFDEDLSDFGDLAADDFESDAAEKPTKEEKLASYANTLQNVFGSDDFGSDYEEDPAAEDDYSPKAKKPNPFRGGAWNDEEEEDEEEDGGEYDDDEYDDEPPRRAPRARVKSSGGGSGGKSNLPLVILLVVLIVAIIAVAAYALFGGKGGDGSSAAPNSSSSVSTDDSMSSSEPVEPAVTPIPRDEWYMKLVNKDSKLTKEECDAITTTNVQGIPVDSRIADALNNMIDAATADGVSLKVVSGYRTYDRQEANYNAGTTDCPPGASEHNLGLSADIMATDETSYVVANFEATEEYAWLKEHAAEYGFILRYPSGKDSVTGFAYEPWHYRFVGVEQAAAINASGLTLEEYLAQDAPTGIPGETVPSADASASVSVAQ